MRRVLIYEVKASGDGCHPKGKGKAERQLSKGETAFP